LIMPQFGICTGIENAAVVRAAGWDFVEGNVQTVCMGDQDEAAWRAAGWEAKFAAAGLGMPAANCLVPASLKVTGPEADLGKLRGYMTNVLRRARRLGLKTVVFGSGGARNVPEGWPGNKAWEQVLGFLQMSAPLAAANDVTIMVEHLNKKECNIINTVAEAMEYVKAAGHPNIQCLVDSWHLWLEEEPLANLEAAMPWIRHVHLADKAGRVAPGQSGSDYTAFFGVLKKAGYDGRISVEAKFEGGLEATAKGVLGFVRRQWGEA
jgi:D-psicose/D-tagatose/L-ribulose 3-epimerase